MLVALGTLESAQTKGTQAIVKAITQLLNYCATHHYAHIRFFASDMYLHVHSNASYQPESEARSRAGGYFFLSDKPPAHINENEPYSPPHKGALRVLLSIIKAVISSATEAELGALFFNAKDATSLRIMLEEMVHHQGATPLQTRQRHCQAESLQGHGHAIPLGQKPLRPRPILRALAQRVQNLAYYFTKHHSPSQHIIMRSQYLLPITYANLLMTDARLC